MPDYSLPPEVPDYDVMWEEVYGDLQEIGPTHRHLTRLMRRLLGGVEYESVLDAGVGFGQNLPVLTAGRNIRRLAGIDVSERAIAHVRARYPGDFYKLDVTREHLPAVFGLVCCSLVLEHVSDDAAALRNLRAMTDRYLLVATIGGRFERYRPWEVQMGHVRNYARGELEGKLSDAGFQVLEAIYWGYPFYSPIARTLQNRMRARHELPGGSRLVARVLYPVFFLNSTRRGDLLVMLARAA